MNAFGEHVRRLRLTRRLLLRHLAAELSIDPSLLSRIECGTKKPTREHVVKLARVLQVKENELLILYLADRLVYALQGESLAIEAMTVAEQRLRYVLTSKSPQTK